MLRLRVLILAVAFSPDDIHPRLKCRVDLDDFALIAIEPRGVPDVPSASILAAIRWRILRLQMLIIPTAR